MLPLPTLLPLLHFLVFSSIWHLKWRHRKTLKNNTNQPNKSGHGAFVVMLHMCSELGALWHICACTGRMTSDLSSLDVLRIPWGFAMGQIYCACSGQGWRVSEVLGGTFNTLALLQVHCKVHLPAFLSGISWTEMWGPHAYPCVTGCRWNHMIPQLRVESGNYLLASSYSE